MRIRMMESIRSRIDRIPMKWMAVSAAVLLVLTLLPILLLGRYNIMCIDDYNYGARIHETWIATGSLGASLQTAWQQNMDFYQAWQGTYISCFLMGLCPMNFNYEIAWVVPILMVGMLTVSTFVLGRHILIKWLGCEKQGAAFVMFLLLFMFYQVIEAPFEGIYWYNGATHYVLMESIFFFALTALSAAVWARKKGAETAGVIAAVLLFAVVGGGNLVTALQAEIIMAFLLIYVIVQKRDRIVAVCIPFLVGSTGFLFNILAPGNTLRGELDQDVGYSAVMSVVLSFYNAIVFMIRWTPSFVILLWLALLPVLWKLMKKSTRSFVHPVWVTVGAYCVLSAMFTPTLYAIGQVGLSRVDNIIQIVYYLCLFIVTAYWLGYISHREAGRSGAGEILGTFLEKTRGMMTMVFLALVLIFFVFTADKNTYTSVSALRSLVNGEGQIFYEEAMERHALYLDEDVTEVVVHPYTAKPALFAFQDLSEDPGNWLNLAVTEYYHKTSVKMSGPEE